MTTPTLRHPTADAIASTRPTTPEPPGLSYLGRSAATWRRALAPRAG